MDVLGVSALFHDSAAALVRDGEVVAAAQEERFTRRKHDAALPREAIAWCLEQGGVEPGGLDLVVYYEKPLSAFARMLRTSVHTAPRGFGQFRRGVPGWLTSKVWVGYEIDRLLRDLGHPVRTPLQFSEHHQAHAAAAFYPSPYERAAVLTVDGVGESATTAIWHGVGNRVEPKRELHFPHSLGLLYSAFTYQCGFSVNGGEYKLMGLAPYGEPTYRDRILDTLVDLRDDGSFHLDVRALGYLSSLKMTNRRFEDLFDGPARKPDAPLTQREADLARSIQAVTEEVVMGLARQAAELTGETNLCLGGGVALNAVANGRLVREGPFEHVWVQPAAGDAGSALGAALLGWYEQSGAPREADGVHDAMRGCRLGPEFELDEIDAAIARAGLDAQVIERDAWADRIAGLLEGGDVVGLFDGPMEFGPRALGGRSILADARSPEAQTTVNARIKRREAFRPFAPSVLAERAGEWFDLTDPTPYMTFVAPVTEARMRTVTDEVTWPPEERVKGVRSEVPAVTHVDGTARIQTVSADVSPRFHELLSAFERRTGCPLLLNTSMNVRGEPIVCTPDDALRFFEATDLDHLVLTDRLVSKAAAS